MRRSKDYPYWATPTQRAWKARKRAELAAIRRAVDVFGFGAAYVPCEEELEAIEHAVKTMRQKLSAKEWGR